MFGRRSLQDQIRSARKIQNLSQQQLAAEAHVSLATLQNIESGRANPELKTLETLLGVLNLEFKVSKKRFSYEDAVPLGLPVMTRRRYREIPPRPRDLVRYLNNLNPNRLRKLNVCPPRMRDAFCAFLWAIQSHYPSLWRTTPVSLQSWFARESLDGRRLKLRRIALQALSEYL